MAAYPRDTAITIRQQGAITLCCMIKLENRSGFSAGADIGAKAATVIVNHINDCQETE